MNALNKTPVAINPLNNNYYNYWMNVEIIDPTGAKVYTDNS